MSSNEDWQRSESSNGLPYYLNHITEETSWNHPTINKLEKSLGAFNKIKYAAYRTASKLRAIQKATCSCNIEISTIIEYFEMQEFDKPSDLKETISAKMLERILIDLYKHQEKKSSSLTKDPSLAAELMLNWILNVHDKMRNGVMRFLAVKISLVILCSGSQRQKLYYIFSQMQNQAGCIDKEILCFFLHACLKIPKYLSEQFFFGDASIEPAISNFFQQAINPLEAISSDFVNWMLAEPQPLVWIPTLYRLAASETTKHEAKCNICKSFPMVGFRYKCVQCFNFDLCQECFWTGRIAKSHKLDHPIQEYCLASSNSSDLKDLQKMFKSKVMKALSRKKRKESKKRFTEIPPDQQSVKSSNRDYEEDNYSEPSNYQAASEYGEDVNDGLQNTKSMDSQNDGLNSWDPNRQPYERSKSQESLPTSSVDNDYSSLKRENIENRDTKAKISPLSDGQNREMENLFSALENDNRELQKEIQLINIEHQNQEMDKSRLIQDNNRLRSERRRMEDRQGILEEHNRQLEMQMQKLRLLLQQQREDLLTMIEIKDTEKAPIYSTIGPSATHGVPEAALPDRKISNSSRKRQTVEPYAVTNLAQTVSSNLKRLRIPTIISFRNSRITPVYETMNETESITEPTRRNAWLGEDTDSQKTLDFDNNDEHEHRYVNDFDLCVQGSNAIENSTQSRYLSNRSGPRTNPDRNIILEEQKPYEEKELDRTVQWAMNNFHLSESDSNC